MAKAKQTQVITETEAHFGYLKGIAQWAKVLEAGDYGNFEINLYPSGDSLNEHIKLFETIREDANKEVEAAGKQVNGLADVYKEDKEGNRFFSFKLPETDYEGRPNKIKIYDVSGTDVTDTWDKLIGNGSTVKIRYMSKPYYMASTKMVGMSYRFYAVQVIDLKEYAGGGDSGFGDETGEDNPF